MTDLPGTAAVGIESVEWSAEAGGNLSLRVTGRWRRRRPAATGQPTLVIEAEGRRHRFPALPEPPSLAGTGPGVWRLSFTIPGWLAPDLGRTWLQFGNVIVPLPVAVPAPSTGEAMPESAPPPPAPPVPAREEPWPPPEGAPGASGAEPGPAESRAEPAPAEGPAPGDSGAGWSSPPPPPPGPAPAGGPPPLSAAHSAALDLDARVTELASRVTGLEQELGEARTERDRLLAEVADRDRDRRLAEQRAHAEQALRQDLSRRLADSLHEAERARQAMGDLAAAEERIRALEDELRQARRRSDEAEQLAAAARAARERAERAAVERDLELARRQRQLTQRQAELAQQERELAQARRHAPSEPSASEAARLRFEEQLRAVRTGGARRIAAEPLAAATRPAAAEPVREPEPVPPPVIEPPAPEPPVPEPPPPPPIPEPPPLPEPPPPPAPPPLPEPPPIPGPPPAPALDATDTAASAPVVATLRQELSARARAEAALRGRLVEAESRLAARVLIDQRTTAVLQEVRGELETLRDALARERTRRQQAEAQAGASAAELDRERALRAEAEQRAAELDRERARRSEAEQRLAELQRQLEGQRVLSRGAYDAIGELRGVLEQLTTPRTEAEPPPPTEADPPAAEADPPAPPDAEADPPGEAADPPAEGAGDGPAEATGAAALVEPARLNDALTRLRETIAPADAAPTPGTAVAARPPSLTEVLDRPSLEGAFRRLVRSDADAAGRLLLELLPLQRVVYPQPVAYDLVLSARRGSGGTPQRCVCVSVPNGTTSIAVQSAPRPRDQVDFQVFGEPARIARLMTAGRFRRRFGLGVAKVRGRREGLSALTALLGAPLDLRDLHRAGVRLDPATAFALVASMIDPAWTVHDRFTLAHQEPETATTFLLVRNGAPLQVTRAAPPEAISATLACPADDLLAVLAGVPVSALTIHGDQRTLVALRGWIKRAQSG